MLYWGSTMIGRLPLFLHRVALLLPIFFARAEETSQEGAAFLKTIQETRDTDLEAWTKQFAFRTLRSDAKAAGADFAVRVYFICSWHSDRVTIYHNAKLNGAIPPASPWKAIVDHLGVLGWADNKSRIGRIANLDEDTVARLQNMLPADEVAALIENPGGHMQTDRTSYFCELVHGDRYLWRYRANPALLEDKLKDVITEAALILRKD